MKTTNRRNPAARIIAHAIVALALIQVVSTADAAEGATAPRNATITGRVSNAATSNNLEGAAVQLAGTSFSAFTSREGTYQFSVPAGSYTLRVSFTGLDDQSIPVTVDAGATLIKDVPLTS